MILIADIQREVAKRRRVPLDRMKKRGPSGTAALVGPPISQARHEAIFLACRLTRHSKSRIAQFFGLKDHTSVVHAVKNVERRMGEDLVDKAFVEQLLCELGERQ